MKIFHNKSKDECSECNLPVKVGILVGEHSWEFEHDTQQAFLCIDCLKRAYNELKLEKNA